MFLSSQGTIVIGNNMILHTGFMIFVDLKTNGEII